MKLSDAEWKVMRAVWKRPGGSVRDILAQIGAEADWSYSTVRTLLARLVEKGVVAVEKDANTGRFRAVLSEKQAKRTAVASLLEKAFEGTFGGLVHHLVADERLTPGELKELRTLLDRETASGGKRPAFRRKGKG